VSVLGTVITVAYVQYEFSTLVGGMVGFGVTSLLLHYDIGTGTSLLTEFVVLEYPY
jgi:hypothetical protein